MQQYSGRVSRLYTKDWQDNKTGRSIVLHSFQLEGNRQYFRTGSNAPTFREGDNISFTADDSGNLQPRRAPDVQILADDAPAPQQQARSPARAANNSMSRDDYWSNKEKNDKARDERYQTVDVPRMSFSAAQDRAVNLVSAALAADAIPVPTKKGDKLDYILNVVDRVSNQFFLDSMHSHERLLMIEAEVEQAAGDVNVDNSEDAGYQYDE